MAAEEGVQIARRSFRMLEKPNGSYSVDGMLDKETGSKLRTALHPLAAPRPGEGGIRDLPRTTSG